MPTYTFKNVNTEEVFERFMTISEMEEMVESGEFVQIIGSPLIVRGVGSQGILKHTPDYFKDILRDVKKNAPGTQKDVMEIN